MIALPCAVYTRKSSEEGLEQGFNSLDAQREACDAFILSQKAQGWKRSGAAYEDGGFSGGSTARPGLQRLLADIALGRVKVIVVYKVDRLTRSLADFAKLVELFDAHGVSFVSVTQQFNTTTSMGRLTLNVLLSFAQFEREVTGERIRDKIAASKRKGLWMGGLAPMGYRPKERTLTVFEPEAERVREIFQLYLQLGNVRFVKQELDRRGWRTPERKGRINAQGNAPFGRGHLYTVLRNPIYIGQIAHKAVTYPGQHPAIVAEETWLAVRDLLEANRTGLRTVKTAIEKSSLATLLFDAQGRRFTPTHAKKGSKRYRYYALQGAEVVAGPDANVDSSGEQARWPAQPLETAVVQLIAATLADPQQLAEHMAQCPVTEMPQRLQRAKELADQLLTSGLGAGAETFKKLVRRVVIDGQALQVHIDVSAIWGGAASRAADGSNPILAIRAPIDIQRRGHKVKLVLRPAGAVAEPQPEPKLVRLLGKAHGWFDELRSGRAESLLAIAHRERTTSSYVARVLHLAFLAPDILQRIHQGQQPEALTPDRLAKLGPLPLAWEAQRQLLGMEPGIAT